MYFGGVYRWLGFGGITSPQPHWQMKVGVVAVSLTPQVYRIDNGI